jgi:ZIP family zinc transporter
MMSWSTFLGLLFITAGSTLLGSLPVLLHKYLKESQWTWWESFCGGVMISASVFSLYLPAYEILKSSGNSVWIMLQATLAGVFFISISHHFMSRWTSDHAHRKAYLFVLAMGVHNVPEGMAVGVDVAALGWSEAMPLSVAIFIQNLPEGLVSSMTFLVSGFSIQMSLLANAITAVIEALSSLGGYTFVFQSGLDLSFLLSFSGACMVSVVVVEGLNKFKHGEAAAFSPSGFGIGLLVCAALDFLL